MLEPVEDQNVWDYSFNMEVESDLATVLGITEDVYATKITTWYEKWLLERKGATKRYLGDDVKVVSASVVMTKFPHNFKVTYQTNKSVWYLDKQKYDVFVADPDLHDKYAIDYHNKKYNVEGTVV